MTLSDMILFNFLTRNPAIRKRQAMKTLQKSTLLAVLIVFCCLLTGRDASALLSDMTIGDSVSINDRLALVDGVALGDGFSLVDGGEGLKLWDMLTIRPMGRIQLQYDSNVFLEENDPKGDWMTTLDLGAEAEMQTGDVLFKGGYVFSMNLFADHDDQSNYNHTAIAKIDWKLTDYEVILQNNFRRFSDRAGTEDTARTSRQKNVTSFDILAEFNRLSFDTGYDLIIEDYLSDEFVSGTTTYDDAEDRLEHIFREEVSYRFAPKTSFVAEADFGFIDYDGSFNSDSYFIQALGGLKGQVLPESVTSLKAGFRFQDYDRTGVEDFAGFVARSNTTKKFGVKNTCTLTTERSVNESTYAGMNYYVLQHVGLGYIHQFNDKLSGHLATSFQRNTYPNATTEGGVTAKRWDHLYTGACGLRYDIRQWLTTAAAYQYSQKDSKFSTFDYIDHLISISAAVQF